MLSNMIAMGKVMGLGTITSILLLSVCSVCEKDVISVIILIMF